MAVPTIYYRFLEQPNFRAIAKTWTKPRLFTCGSAPIRAEVLPELESILGKPVINRFGMTEGFVITSLPLDGPRPNGSVGKPLDGIEVRIANEPEASATDVGPVQLRGPNLFREYWNKPDATKDAFASGWFETGDLGSLDANGFLTLVGRKNDLIITSGFNVYPQVVERVINECPGVRESAVIGVPDAHKGESVVAFVVGGDATLDEGLLRAFWSERLVDYQRPKDVVFIDALPRNAMGKVLRRELRDKFSGGPERKRPEGTAPVAYAPGSPWRFQMSFAERVQTLRPTAVNRVLAEMKQLQAEGRSLVSLMRGQPDTPTPTHIVTAAEKALRDGHTGYPDNQGEPILRRAVAEKLWRDNDLTYDPNREILITDAQRPASSRARRFDPARR